MPTVKVFSTTWCAYCHAEKQFLTEHKVPFTDINVEEDQAAAEEMIRLTGQMGVPVTLITHDDDKKTIIIGFDQDRLASELNLH